MGGGVEVVRDWEVRSLVMNREYVLHKAVSKPLLGFPRVEEATSGTADTIDHISGCAGYVEKSLFCSYTGPIPHLFLHYIDDCISAALCFHEEFEQFIHPTNTFHPKLKFTWTISDTSLSFLDLSVSIS
eukprot:g18773.t1